MITMGLDLSTKSTGYSVFENQNLLDYGVIKAYESDWRERLYHQATELGEILDQYSPECVYIEDVPLSLNGGAKIVLMLGAMQGIIYGLGASKNIPMKFIQPSVWRSPLGLYDGTKQGKHRDALKKKSVEKANELFGLNLIYKSPSSKFNCDDISDAILLCYSQITNRYFGKSVDK